MDDLLCVALSVALVWWTYQQGKRTGSRKGYRVGRARNRRRRR